MVNQEVLWLLQTVFPELEWKIEELTEFLKTVGLMNPGSNLYREREKKVYEVAHFSGHIVKCVENISRKRAVTLLDCGCGRSYLPFFLNYVLTKLRRPIHYIGVDSNPALIERTDAIKNKLGYMNIEFHAAEILDFEPQWEVNILSALHACDTATDDAIAKGIRLSSRFIIVAPCCQRQVIRQIGRVATSKPALKPLFETKVSKEYVGVALTETLRKLALEYFGYKVGVFEFVSSKHTPKNIMLRAEKMHERNETKLQAYRDLRDYFNVKPNIQKHLDELK